MIALGLLLEVSVARQLDLRRHDVRFMQEVFEEYEAEHLADLVMQNNQGKDLA